MERHNDKLCNSVAVFNYLYLVAVVVERDKNFTGVICVNDAYCVGGTQRLFSSDAAASKYESGKGKLAASLIPQVRDEKAQKQ